MKRIALFFFAFCILASTVYAVEDGAVPTGRVAAIRVAIDNAAGTTYTVQVANVDRTSTHTQRVFVAAGQHAEFDVTVPRLAAGAYLDPQPWRVKIMRRYITGETGTGWKTVNELAVVTTDPLNELLTTNYRDLATSTALLTAAQAHAMRVYWLKVEPARLEREKAAALATKAQAQATADAITSQTQLISE